jgi:pilus assembly protein Flp/PilA
LACNGSRLIHGVVGFLAADDGPTAVEYGGMLALVIVVCIGLVSTLGSNTDKIFTCTSNAAKIGAN